MRTFAQKPKTTPQPIVHLQRMIGNQASQRLPQSNPEERNAVLTDTAPPHFGFDFSRIPVTAPGTDALQAKLAIDKPGDTGQIEAPVVQQGAAKGSTQPIQRSSHILQIGAQDRPMARPVSDALPMVQRQASGGPSPASEAEAAVRHAQAHRSVGNILFDSWGNDVRDNDNDGRVDSGSRETGTYDGQHYSGNYTNFGVVAGTYVRGWADDQGVVHGRVIVPTTRTITGSFKYRVCADIVSQAYADAGLMNHMRSTGEIISRFRRIGTVWHNRSTFPSEYLPGDFVGTYAAGHGGHSGIVTTRSSTSSAPTVIELPGPSTQADAGTYDPASTNDVKEQTWSKHGVGDQYQYLGRYTGRRH